MMRRTVFGYLLFLALAIPASGVEPEPSCERQAVEAIRPAVHRVARLGSSSAAARYVFPPNIERDIEQERKDQARWLYFEMKEFERECLRRKLKP